MPDPAMHPDEQPTDESLVRRLLTAQFPEWAHLPIEPVPSAGTDNALYRLGDELVVRLPRIHWARHHIDRQEQWLPLLAPHLPLRVPVPLAVGAPGQDYPWCWSVWPWLHGENPVVGHLTDAGRTATELAGFVRALHGLDATGAPRSSRGEPLESRDAATRFAAGALDGEIDTDAVLAAWDASLAAPSWSGSPVWIHGDLTPGNLLCIDHSLDAVIDFAPGVGDPACDLIVAWNLLPEPARHTYREALGVDDAAWARGKGWALSIALIALPYYLHTNPAIVANSRHVIAEVLAERQHEG